METTKFKKMMRGIENALTAASFAEEGEREAARTIFHEGRNVLVGLKEGQIDARTLKYASNTAKRIGAQLHILYVGDTAMPAISDPGLAKFLTDLVAEEVPYRVVRRSGCLKRQIIDYTNSEKEILFAVIESPDHLDAGCAGKERSLSDLWQKLKCPLVVVMDQAKA